MPGILSQPYPYDRQWKHQLRVAAWISVFVTLFLLVFRPFGLGNYEMPGLPLKIAGYGVLTFFTLILVFALTRLLPEPDEDKWTTGKEILSQLGYILVIGMANVLYTHFVFGMNVSFYTIAIFQVYTLLIGIFPVSFFVLANQVRLSRTHWQTAAALSEELRQAPPVAASSDRIRLASENDKEIVELPIHDLVLIESSDNYSTVYFVRDGRIESKLLRSTLKRLESQVSHEDIVRCHRTYIVNLKKVVSVNGNAQGYRLRFNGFDQTFPVSRSMNEAIRQKLHHLSGT